MDSRLDVFAALGLQDGEAHVLRNAGGVITDDVIRSLAVSQRRLGTREVMLIHHTDCGMQTLTDDGFRAELQEATGVAPAFAIESFSDVDADVRQSILRVRRSPFLLHRDRVRGFVYDVDTHALREVVPARTPSRTGARLAPLRPRVTRRAATADGRAMSDVGYEGAPPRMRVSLNDAWRLAGPFARVVMVAWLLLPLVLVLV